MSEQLGSVTLSDIVAIMVHDLNNPIAALGTNLRYLENTIAPSASTSVVETLSDMRMLCDMLRRLVSNLGMLGQDGAPPARRLPIDMMDLAAASVERLGKQAEASEVRLVLEPLFHRGEVFVEGDPMLCERALDNLLTFAIERASTRAPIFVSAMKDSRIGVRIRCVLRPEHVESSEHSSRTRTLQAAFGRGLSLLCARVSAEATGGRVDVRRDKDEQTTFELLLNVEDKQIA